MKKFFIFAVALACANFTLVACDDDDDDDSEEDSTTTIVADFTDGVTYDDALYSYVTSIADVNTYIFTDADEVCDIYTYATSEEIVSAVLSGTASYVTNEAIATASSDWYGGFIPTWFTATDTATSVYAPISGTFNSGSGALLCNPGTACRAMFMQHSSSDYSLSSLLSSVTLAGIYVNNTWLYKALANGDTDVLDEYEIDPLEAGQSITLVVNGYVSGDYSYDSFSSFFSSIASDATGLLTGGVQCENTVTLAECDSDGNVTVLEDWTFIDLSDMADYKLIEVSIETDGFDEDEELNDYLNIVLVDDITYASESTLSSLISSLLGSN